MDCCDKCRHYRWYFDRCEKWKCKVDGREVHDCFEPHEPPKEET